MNSCTIAYTLYEEDWRVSRYAEALVAPGSRTDAIAVRLPGRKRIETINGVKLYRIQRRNYDKQGGPFDYLFKMVRFFLMSSAILLVNHLRYGYKVIIIHNVPDFFVFAAFIPRLLGAKIIFDIHDIMPEFFCQRFNKPLDSKTAKLLRWSEKKAVQFSDFVIVGNDLWREKIAARDTIPRERCLGMVNYPHMEYFRDTNYTVRVNSLKIVYPGHLSHHHGVDIAVRAMPEVLRAVPNATFQIFAASWIPQFRLELEALIRQMRLEGVVSIANRLAKGDLIEVYKTVDLGVVPKRGGPFAGEAFSSKILDFMASGIPIVASHTVIDEYYFDDSMISFFEPENHEDMARRIVELFRDPSRRRALSIRGKEYAERNSWDIKKKEFVAIANSIVKDTNR